MLAGVYTVHTACFPTPQDSSQHIQWWKPYAVTWCLPLLKMGIMMPETCWANGLLIKYNLLHLVGLTRHFILKTHGHTTHQIFYNGSLPLHWFDSLVRPGQLIPWFRISRRLYAVFFTSLTSSEPKYCYKVCITGIKILWSLSRFGTPKWSLKFRRFFLPQCHLSATYSRF